MGNHLRITNKHNTDSIIIELKKPVNVKTLMDVICVLKEISADELVVMV